MRDATFSVNNAEDVVIRFLRVRMGSEGEEAYEDVIANVGCSVPMLDDHDKRVIQEVLDGTAAYSGSKSGLPGLPDHEDDVGGYEDYPKSHTCR
jgi:hypothetical protein